METNSKREKVDGVDRKTLLDALDEGRMSAESEWEEKEGKMDLRRLREKRRRRQTTSEQSPLLQLIVTSHHLLRMPLRPHQLPLPISLRLLPLLLPFRLHNALRYSLARKQLPSALVGARRGFVVLLEVRVGFVREDGAEPEGLVREGVRGGDDHGGGDVDLVAAVVVQEERSAQLNEGGRG
jgi:hypothetical protein